MKVCGDSRCAQPGKPQPAEAFPVNRSRRDGRHLYCRKCCQRRKQQWSAAKKAREIAQLPARKSCRRAIETRKRILQAVRSGHSTRLEIKRYTKINIDEVCDVLAELLFDDRLVRLQTVNGERRFVA